MEQNNTFKFQGEGLPSRVIGIGALLIAIGFGVKLMLALNTKGLLIGGILIALILWYVKRVIRHVTFKSDHVFISYFYGNSKTLDYNHIDCVYKSREGIAPIFVNVIKMKEGIKPKKATFFCSEEEYGKLKLYLTERGVTDITNKPKILRK